MARSISRWPNDTAGSITQGRPSESLSALPGGHLVVRPDDLPAQPELLVSLDVGSADRLGSLARLLDSARQTLVIDHHASNTRFGTVNLVDPSAAATAVLAAELIDRLGVALTKNIALGLYAGLVTDTGSLWSTCTTVASGDSPVKGGRPVSSS